MPPCDTLGAEGHGLAGGATDQRAKVWAWHQEVHSIDECEASLLPDCSNHVKKQPIIYEAFRLSTKPLNARSKKVLNLSFVAVELNIYGVK